MISFIDACVIAANTPEFVEQYNRITGSNFQPNPKRSIMEKMIDEKEVFKFAAFFYEFVWVRLPDDSFQGVH